MGPGGISQSGGHTASNLNDNVAGMPPTSMMQSQMSNGEISMKLFPPHLQIYSANTHLSVVGLPPTLKACPILALLHACLELQLLSPHNFLDAIFPAWYAQSNPELMVRFLPVSNSFLHH